MWVSPQGGWATEASILTWKCLQMPKMPKMATRKSRAPEESAWYLEDHVTLSWGKWKFFSLGLKSVYSSRGRLIDSAACHEKKLQWCGSRRDPLPFWVITRQKEVDISYLERKGGRNEFASVSHLPSQNVTSFFRTTQQWECAVCTVRTQRPPTGKNECSFLCIHFLEMPFKVI